MTGSCYCHPYVTGKFCDRCEQNAFNYTASGCLPCNCNNDGSVDLQCDSVGDLQSLFESVFCRFSSITVVPHALFLKKCLPKLSRSSLLILVNLLSDRSFKNVSFYIQGTPVYIVFH